MAIPWMVALQAVPWADLLKNAPKIADGAGRIWDSVASRKSNADTTASDRPSTPALSMTSLAQRIGVAETSIEALNAQMASSLQVTAALAEQNAELVARLYGLRQVIWILLGACIVFGLVGVSALVMVLRHPG